MSVVSPKYQPHIKDTITRPDSPKVVRERKSRDFKPDVQSPHLKRRDSIQKMDLNSDWSLKYQIEDEDYAKGAYGKIMLAKDKINGEKVVIKKIPTSTPIRMINNEVKAGKWIGQHPNIAGLLQYTDKPDFHYLTFQYINAQDLFTYLEKLNFSPRPDSEARSTITQILSAIQHIHSKNIAHRDIKLENILIDKNGRVFVIDLGLCAFIEEGKPCRDWCGSDNYLAPEIVRRIPYNGYKADVFSIGVVLFALLFGVFPFEGLRVNGVHSLRTLKVRFPSDVNVSLSAKELLVKMLEDDPEKRYSIADVMNHDWILGDDEPKSNFKLSCEAITAK
jgi:serine/threonine protein kinase